MPTSSKIRKAISRHCRRAASKRSSPSRIRPVKTRSSSSGSKPLHVFAKNIVFQVHGISDLALLQRGHFQRMGYNPNAETFFPDFGHGQADTIKGDRAFRNHVTHDLR